MLNKIIKKLLVVSATLFMGAVLYAQEGASTNYTPYSIFGIGDISMEGTAYNRSMGGIGIANRNNRFINIQNPAAVTARDTLSFMSDFGLASNNKILSQGDSKTANNTFNLYDFIISFPIYKSSAMYFGIDPYSSVNYGFISNYTDPNLIGSTGSIRYTATGQGGLNHMYVGGGITFWKHLSIGAQMSYYFGNIEKATNLSFANSSYRSIASGTNLSLRSSSGKFGVQYESKVGNNSTITVGATYKLGSNITGYTESYKYANISNITDTLSYSSDTLKNIANKVKMADEIGVGISYKYGDKLMVELDYLRSDWTKSNFNTTSGFANVGSNTRFTTTASESIRGGFEYTPNRNDIRYFLKRVTYRGGAYYDKEYYLLNDNPVKTIGITLGATIPIYRWYNGLTFGMEIGQRGLGSDQLFRERFINFSVSLNIFDIWFQKIRYD